jgi:hypothetical protein
MRRDDPVQSGTTGQGLQEAFNGFRDTATGLLTVQTFAGPGILRQIARNEYTVAPFEATFDT